MKELSIIILAAGFGTRMKAKKAKVLFELSGEAMINIIIKKAYELSDDVSVVLSHQLDEVQEVIFSKFPKVKIIEQDMENFPGTAGALKNLEFTSEKTLVICGDMPLVEVEELRALTEKDCDLALSVFMAENPNGYGRVVALNGKIEKIVEQKDANSQELTIKLVNAGAYCFKSEVLAQILPKIGNENAQKEYYLTDSIALANAANLHCEAITVDEKNFMGINDKFALNQAEEILQNRIKKNLMLKGIRFRLASSTYIDINATFEGESEIQENVSIIGACQIKESIIKSSSIIESSLIENSDIGPMAHIRPKCEIKNSHIGNFVELKNAQVNGIKAGHLSYLGDCIIDEGSNIGCGTITCNYDGKAKHKTVIGKNVFIGSDSQLVAPVILEDNTIIAAGSTITEDVKSGDLGISRVKQNNVKGFFYKFFGAKK